MFTNKIRQMRDYCMEMDDRTCKRLRINQFGNMLCIIMDKGLLDESAETAHVVAAVESAFDTLQHIVNDNQRDRQTLRLYNRRYVKALEAVRKYYGLEPVGSIQSRWMVIGVAVGAAIGAGIMTVMSPGFMSVGIAAGIGMGVAVGQKKEQEARNNGRLF